MVRLMLVLAPVMCILSGIAVSTALGMQMKYLDAPRQGSSQSAGDRKSKKADAAVPFRSEVAWTFTVLISLFLVTMMCIHFCFNYSCINMFMIYSR
jgi:dolichyl-diphosphooligosaccharide--protein glycosyltransferase